MLTMLHLLSKSALTNENLRNCIRDQSDTDNVALSGFHCGGSRSRFNMSVVDSVALSVLQWLGTSSRRNWSVAAQDSLRTDRRPCPSSTVPEPAGEDLKLR